MITIIDYGMGNLGSIQNMFKRINVESEITGDPEVISRAKKILLPGVGAFDAAMERIDGSAFKDVLNKKVLEEKVPILGVCLGMQLLTKRSDEGEREGLGWVNAETKKFTFTKDELKIPHMGWNLIDVKKETPLLKDLPEEPSFYFVHSYYVQCNDPADVMTTTQYGLEFHSMLSHENIYGAQFHPEKSHKYGMKILENFSKL